jgi:hypothetical protein
MSPDVSWVRLSVADVRDKLRTIRRVAVAAIRVKREMDRCEMANFAYNYWPQGLFH